MQNSTTLSYLYLPWLTGLLIMAVVLVNKYSNNTICQPVPVAHATPKVAKVPEAFKKVITTMPYFPGCENARGKSKRDCSHNLMKTYLHDHAAYPVGSPTQKTAGAVIVEFLVRPDGKVRDPKLLRDPGYGRGADALRIINNMEAEGILWEPATRNGRPISSRMTITIRYNMVWAG